MLENFKILMSGLKININCRSDFVKHFCKDYIFTSREDADISVTVSDQAIESEQKVSPFVSRDDSEILCIYRAIAEALPDFDRFVFHGAAIQYEGRAYLFTAPSGTGKTTHINLWKKHLGDKVTVINGDKPIINMDSEATVYGTPWAGKENLQNNISAPLAAVCIIKQSAKNTITRVESKDAINHLMRQIYLPHNPSALSKTLSLLGSLIENTPVYMLECDISSQAFETSFSALVK